MHKFPKNSAASLMDLPELQEGGGEGEGGGGGGGVMHFTVSDPCF